MKEGKRSKSSILLGTTAAASALLIGGGIAGLSYGVYRLVRDHQFHSNPYRILHQAIAADVERQQLVTLEDNIARTHYSVQSLSTDQEKEEAVVQILTNASIRVVAAPLAVSVNTFLSVVILCTVEVVTRLKKRRLTAPIRTSLIAELHKLFAEVDVFSIVEQAVKDELRYYTEENLKVVTPPATFTKFLQSFLTEDLLSVILEKTSFVAQKILNELNSASLVYLPLSILYDILSDNAVGTDIKAFDPQSYILMTAITFFEGLGNEFLDLIASKSGFQFAYYARPLLSLDLSKQFPAIDESLINFLYLLIKARVEQTSDQQQ